MKYSLLIMIIYICVLAFMSLITFFLFVIDKKKAENGSMRIQEKTLLGFTVFGGALGALIGRLVARHKTDKIYFSLTIYFSILTEAAALGFMIYMFFRG